MRPLSWIVDTKKVDFTATSAQGRARQASSSDKGGNLVGNLLRLQTATIKWKKNVIGRTVNQSKPLKYCKTIAWYHSLSLLNDPNALSSDLLFLFAPFVFLNVAHVDTPTSEHCYIADSFEWKCQRILIENVRLAKLNIKGYLYPKTRPYIYIYITHIYISKQTIR